MDYGILAYDVPLDRRSVYNKLRKKLRRCTVPMTWSVYLVPLALRDQVLNILSELDEDDDHNGRIQYKFLKQDPSENSKIDQMVQDQFQMLLAKTKDDLYQKIGEAQLAFESDECSMDAWTADIREACCKAKKKVNEARKLALVFDVSNVIEVGFEGIEKVVEAKREMVKAEIKKRREEEKALKAAEK